MIQMLKKIILFETLLEHELAKIEKICRSEAVAKDTAIFKEGEAGDRCYVIMKGEVRISKFIPNIGEEALAVLKPGDTFGEMALIDNFPRSAWKVAYADSEEVGSDDGNAENVFDLQSTTFWHTQWEGTQPEHPHQLVLDLGSERTLAGLRYLPRQDSPNGRIKDYRIYLSSHPFPGTIRTN